MSSNPDHPEYVFTDSPKKLISAVSLEPVIATVAGAGRYRRAPAGGRLKDFLLIENIGPKGRLGVAWVYDLHVAPASAPAGQR